MNFEPRARWRARRPRSTSTLWATKPSTLHYTGPTITVSGKRTWSHDKCAGLIRGIQNYHMDANGWSDIAYNLVACPHGTVFEGRGLRKRSAANGTNSANATSHAILCLGGEGNAFGEGEKRAARDARDHISRTTGVPNSLVPHSSHKPTKCPGDARRNWIRSGSPGGTGGGGSPLPTLRQGSRGDHVKIVQAVLRNKAGRRELAVDGIFGPKTDRAVRDLQRMFKLSVDGIVGSKTWGALAVINA